MPARMAIPKENLSGERRVALDPSVASRFAKLGLDVRLQRGAGDGAHFPDSSYKDIQLVDDAAATYDNATVILKVQPPTLDELDLIPEGAVIIGFMQAHRHPDMVKKLCDRRITSFAMELVPRISRAQSMDALSSQAAVAGYKVSLMAADLSPGFFPMLTTAAGTIRPAVVVVVGAGVAGLQAIATCKRLGARVEAYDIRSAAREQVESLGAKMIDTGVSAEGEGGYARELTADEKKQQAAVLADRVAAAQVVITTAAIPGRNAPIIITKDMVERMKPGSIIVDLAAESGGNCEVTEAGKLVRHNDVVVYGPVNIPSQVPIHATEMYAKNLFNFLSPMINDGDLNLDWDDEVISKSALTHDGQIRHEATRRQLGA